MVEDGLPCYLVPRWTHYSAGDFPLALRASSEGRATLGRLDGVGVLWSFKASASAVERSPPDGSSSAIFDSGLCSTMSSPRRFLGSTLGRTGTCFILSSLEPCTAASSTPPPQYVTAELALGSRADEAVVFHVKSAGGAGGRGNEHCGRSFQLWTDEPAPRMLVAQRAEREVQLQSAALGPGPAVTDTTSTWEFVPDNDD